MMELIYRKERFMRPILFHEIFCESHYDNTCSNIIRLHLRWYVICTRISFYCILLKVINGDIPIQFHTVCYAYMIHEDARIFLDKPKCCMDNI